MLTRRLPLSGSFEYWFYVVMPYVGLGQTSFVVTEIARSDAALRHVRSVRTQSSPGVAGRSEVWTLVTFPPFVLV